MPKRASKGLVVVSFKVKPHVRKALQHVADKEGVGPSTVGAQLLELALENGGALAVTENLRDRGYQDGLKKGLHDAHEAIRSAFSKLFM